MYTLLKPIQVREELLKREIKFFSPLDFVRIFEISASKAKYFLEKQSNKNGLFLRLKQGLYSLRTDMPSEEEISNCLYKPSYISFEYALFRYGIIPEAVYSITSATTKPTREYKVLETSFSYLSIKKEAYIGFILQKENEKQFFIAEPEKALVDYMYFVSLGKKTKNERLFLDGLDKDKVFSYAKIFNRANLIKKMEEIFK